MTKTLCGLLLALVLSGCATAPDALVPTPWGVVGMKSFGESPDPAKQRSSQLAAIEAHRHDGLVSSASSSAVSTLASR